ncbi:5-formyltetrahydrofolate cyclo-ligase [Myroides guanonis]|uniref:5-formyltetrahydrofolate cyclo-ligase n=1 Tax=Myroides guanonis TaxID=1150112 RepID=A0A1I3MVK8_9FLAO|nr:5-formyltetrahydrofolate cyclo-ligase [Myroides guanonis]SFJ01144.1 5-formyltetrahydrofolate cyclo-ligase [Myroides guanonis]
MTKSEIRNKYIELRNQLTLGEAEDLSIDIANQTLKLPIWNFSNYHLFLSIANKKEINTEFILHILTGKDKNTILSKSNFKDGTMEHFLLTDNTILKVNSYGIPEPINGFKIAETDIEVVFVPLLAFDKSGNRVGYGKGFYDRFLSLCSPNTIKVGLSFFEAEEQITEISENDIPLDYCVTPKGVYKF